MSVNVKIVKRACADCVCVVNTADAVQAEGRIFCGENRQPLRNIGRM